MGQICCIHREKVHEYIWVEEIIETNDFGVSELDWAGSRAFVMMSNFKVGILKQLKYL
jgi:hypothetical protein